jgi:DNA repair exonuclease SbcCD ATPase subunit
MLFTKLKLNYFGRFHDKEIELKPGINLIYGDNEAGKSTIHAFIKGMLFGIERLRGRGSSSKVDTYARYLPWDYPGAYSGNLDIRIGDKDYRLQRSFHANDKSFNITDLATGREVKLADGVISELVPGLTESIFKNTISIEQLKAQTDAELAAEVRNYITNLSITKSKEIDVNKALSLLNEKRRTLEAADCQSELQSLQDEIEAGLVNEERMDQLSIKLKELLGLEQKLKDRKEAESSSVNSEETERMEQLPAILENYKSYQEISGQLQLVKQKYRLLQEQIASVEKKQIPEEGLKKDVRAAEQLKAKELELITQEQELNKQKDGLKKAAVKGMLFTLLPFFTASFVVMLLANSIPKGDSIYLLLFSAGMVSYSLLTRHNMVKQKKIIQRLTELNNQLQKVQAELDALLMKYQVSSIEAFSQKQAEALKSFYELENMKEQLKGAFQREKELEDNRDMLYETIMKYMQYFIREDELSELSVRRLQEVIRQKKQATSGILAELTTQSSDCKLRIEKLKWEMSGLEGNEEQLLKNRESYDKLMQGQKEAAVEWEAVKLELNTIQELSADIHDSFGQQLNKAVSEVISEFTGGRYNELKIDERLEVKVGWKGSFIPLDKLSAGTIDQVYFSLRLAVADLLLGKEEIPLLLDDSFALYDESRVKAAITRIAGRKQIILFTCHRREETLIKELGLSCNMIDLSCE